MPVAEYKFTRYEAFQIQMAKKHTQKYLTKKKKSKNVHNLL